MTLKKLGIHFVGVTIFLALYCQVAECAQIVGYLTDSNGSPIDGVTNGITVFAYKGNPCESPQYAGQASVLGTGRFTIKALPIGVYYVKAINGDQSAYLDEWWASPAGAFECSGAQAVALTTSTSSLTANFQLDQGASISGTLYQSNGTTALTGVSIQIDAVTGAPCGTSQVKRYATTSSSNGTYSIKGLPTGTYYLSSKGVDQSGYIDEWWASPASTPDCSGAQAVEISTNGQQISGKNFQLALGGSISGTLYQDNGTTPVTGVNIYVMLYEGGTCDTRIPFDWKRNTFTNSTDGTYIFRGLPLGTYYLWSANMQQSDYLNEWWASPKSTFQCSDAQAVIISSPGQAFTGKNFQLQLGGSISGTVYQSDGTTPVTGDTILVRAALGSACDSDMDPVAWPYSGWAFTNPDDGTYSMRGLPLTSYSLVSSNWQQSDYLNEWWASPKSTFQCSGAQAVELSSAGQVVTGKNFQLERGGSISGTLYKSDGTTPVTGGSIQIWAVADSSCTGSVVSRTDTNPSDGTYSLRGLPLGTYYLWSYNQELAYFTNEWWASPASVYDCSDAQPVIISSPGQAITGKNFQVDIGATISGTVYQDDGTTPVTGVPLLVSLYKGNPCSGRQWVNDTSADQNDGTYAVLGIQPGTYYILATNQNKSDYSNNWWASPESAGLCTGAQAVEISALGEVVTGKNFQLKLGGSISGTVYQSNGTTPLTGKSIQIEAVLGSPCDTVVTIGQAQTDPSDGTYLMRGLPLATYSLLSNNMEQSDYVNEWWASPSSTYLCGSAQTVSLSTEGEAVTGKNFQLDPGGRISGQVLGDQGPIGNAGILIYAGPCGQDLIGGTVVDEGGHYTTGALPPGDLYMKATGPSHLNYIDRYYDGGDGVTDLECGFAAPVSVLSGGNTPGIDFHLKRGDKRVNLNQVVVLNGELFGSFGVHPGFRDLVASATLSMPNGARGVNGLYVFNLEEDDLLLSAECTYLAYWSKRFGSVAAADYGSYDLTVGFKDGVQEVYNWQLKAATVVPVSNIAAAVNNDGSALVTWDRNTSSTYTYQVRVSDGTQEIYRSNYFSNIQQLAIPADALKCLEIGRTHRWQVRVYDRSPLTGSSNRLETVEIESPYAPLSLNNRVTSAGVYKYGGNLAFYFDVRPGSRDHVKAACVTGPAGSGFSYCFNMDNDYTDLSTETRIYKGWFKQNALWPITNGTYTFSIDYDDDLNGTTDYTEVVTRSLSADDYIPVDDITMHGFVWPDGAMELGWDLSGAYGLKYEVVISSPDGSEEYYGSGRSSTDNTFMSLSFYDLRALKRGRTYQWFVRSWSADLDTMEQSASQEFYYDPAPVHDATKATFNANSATITNPYMPFKVGDKLIYTGTGALKGYGRYWEALAAEGVDGVHCLKLVTKGNGNNPNPDLDPDWIYGWVAQDTGGNVWLLKVYENKTGETLFSGRAQAVLWMPATPVAGTIFRQMMDEYTQLEKSGLEVILGTGLGPYQNSVRLLWTDFTDMELEYLVPHVGLVVEEYNEGLSGWKLQQIIRAGSSKDELVSNFGPAYGLYQYDRTGGWKQWNAVNPSLMVTGDLNGNSTDVLVAAFPGYSLYTYDSANGWQRINTEIPQGMISFRNGIACDYGAAYGLWLWDRTGGWQQINTVDPHKMIAADIDGDGQDELIVSFIGYGLYSYDDPGVWTLINAVMPDAMVRYSHGVVCDFGAAHGLWSYSKSGGWSQLNAADPDRIVAVDIDNDGQDELVVSFAGYGLYTYEPVGEIWQLINAVIPDGMIRQGNGIAVDYGAAYGLWVWSQGGGWVQRNTVDPGKMTTVDLDKDGVEELVVSFSGFGLYCFDETNGWQLLNAVVPDDMKPINFYP